ncbi:MAG: hypothetical protein WBG32_17025 [Nodosilinea sp.]
MVQTRPRFYSFDDSFGDYRAYGDRHPAQRGQSQIHLKGARVGQSWGRAGI